MSRKYKHPQFSIGNETNKNPFKAINAAFTEHYPSYYKNHLTEIFVHAQKAEDYKKVKYPILLVNFL